MKKKETQIRKGLATHRVRRQVRKMQLKNKRVSEGFVSSLTKALEFLIYEILDVGQKSSKGKMLIHTDVLNGIENDPDLQKMFSNKKFVFV
jgi:hypothetical protein